MKMEQQPPSNPQRLESTGTEKAFNILQDALDCKRGMERGNQCPEAIQSVCNGGCTTRTIPHQVKEEPENYLASHWEAQWQEFLQTVEFPSSGLKILQLSEASTPWNDTKAFLVSFEQVAKACKWPKEDWVAQLLPAFSGEAEMAFNALEGKDRGDYGKVKAALLRRDAVSREKSRQHFRRFCYLEAEGPRAVYGQLQELCHQWLKVERHTKEQILELLVLEQFLMILPPEIQSWLKQHGPETCAQAVSLAEDFLYKQQEPEKQANQDTFEKVAVNLSEAESAAADTQQKQLYKGSKQEDEFEAGPFAGKDGMTIHETGVAEDPTKAGPCEVSLWKAEEIVPHCCMQEKPSTNQKRLESRESTLAGGEADAPVPYVGDYKAIIVATIQTGNDTGKKQNASQAYGRNLNRGSTVVKNRHTGGKGHKCLVCGKFFLSSSKLIIHQRAHTGEKPYECAACGKTFQSTSVLYRHQRVHTGEKPHKCPVCGRRFGTGSNLNRHQKIHTGEKPFECSDCGKSFIQKGALNKHHKIHSVQGASLTTMS
ncbi:zinc finger and SCAN domain-containing protein 31-like isoform X1 [Thamnophis elegans]|uniref:zinc finger and SCAN domain-containing protein 31-like isoform X1 n=1 Tax=Thamnophis elegans TaxID=35005 RepID=UPI0013781DE1|nr:zinc finger and SCAN domain-containing protein 31-like isoform X1 [Thamnophis elegans]XP_032093010.1 zinc finger and SCAN domain-containing protein 31-like isoform X1 [Thamnophis elegans]